MPPNRLRPADEGLGSAFEGSAGRMLREIPHGETTTYGDLAAVVESTGADRVTLLGFSWGASVALAFAVAHPDRVDRFVFLSPGGIPWDGSTRPPGSSQSRLSAGDLAGLYELALQPRIPRVRLPRRRHRR